MEASPPPKPILIYDRIDANRRKTLLLLGVFAIVLLPVVFYLGQYLTFILGLFMVIPILSTVFGESMISHDWFILGLSGFSTLLLTVLTIYLVYLYSARLVLHITKARPLKPEEGRELRRLTENLSIGSGLPQPRLMIMDSMATNAFSTGLTPEQATLVVTQGLLEALDRRELEGVIAQELSQIGNYDMRLSTILAAMVTILWWPLSSVKRFLTDPSAKGSRAGGCLTLFLFVTLLQGLIGLVLAQGTPMAGIILAALLLLTFVLVAAPILCLLIYRAISRSREFLADADAALLTRHPAGLAQALEKMGVAGNARMPVSRALAALFIVNPLPPEDVYFGTQLFSPHPPLEARIELLTRMGGVTAAMLQKAREAGITFSRAASFTWPTNWP
jgi:heat shock protein HtpX